MTNTDNNGENNENDHPPMTLEELYAEIQRLSNVETALINVRQEANDAAEEINARRLYLVGQLRQQYLNNQSATTTAQPLQIQIAAAINGNVDQDGQQENDGPKEAAASSNSPTDGNALGAGSVRPSQRDDPSISLPQPLAQRNGNTSSKVQQLSAPPILSCNQQHRQQQQQQQEELHHSEAEVQPLSEPAVEVIQIDDDDEEEELEQENAMEVDGSTAEDTQNEANENIDQCQEELHNGRRLSAEEQRSNLAEWNTIILIPYIVQFCANVQNEVMPEANINMENEDQPMNVEPPAENNQSRIEELEPPQNDEIQQMNAEEDVQDEEEVEHHCECECDDGHFNQQPEEEEDEPANENEIGGANVGGNQQTTNGKRLKRRYPGEPWCLRCLFHQQFGWYPREEYDNDPELKKRFGKYIRQRTMIPEEDEELKEEFEQFLRQYLNHREMNGDEPFPQQKRATRGRSRSRGRNQQQPNVGASENDGSGALNVQSTSSSIGNNNANIAQGSPPIADANPSLNSSDAVDGNDRKKLEANRSIPKKPSKQKAAANPPNGPPSTSTTFDEILANMERMPSSSSNFNGRTLDQRLFQDVLPNRQPAQTNLASITEATLGQQEQNNSTNEQMDANEAPQSPHPSNSDGIQQNEEMLRKKAKPSPISTVNGQQNSQSQQSSTPQQQRNPPEQGVWMTSDFTPSPSNMADDVFEFPATSPPHDGNIAIPPAVVGNDQSPQNFVERTPLGAIHPNAPNKKRRSDSPRKGDGEKRAKKAEKPVAGSAALNPKYERVGGGGQRNVENTGNNGHQSGRSNEGNVGRQSAAHNFSDAHAIASPPTPMSPNENVDHPSGTNQQKNMPKNKDCGKPTPKSKKGWKPTINPHGPLAKKLLGMDNAPAEQPTAVQRQNSANGQANEDQMRQSTSQNIHSNVNYVQSPPNSPVVRQEPSVVAEANPQGNLAKKSAGMNAQRPGEAQRHNTANGPKIGANANSVQPPANAKTPAVRRQERPVDPRLGYAPPVMPKNNANGALAKKSGDSGAQRIPFAKSNSHIEMDAKSPAAMNGQNSSVTGGHTTLAKNANLAKKSAERGIIRIPLAKSNFHGIEAMDPPQRPAAMNGQNSSVTDAQMRQSTSRNIGANGSSVHRDSGPALHDQQLIVSAMLNPKGQLAKTMGDPRAIRTLLAKPHSHKNTGIANGEKRHTVPAPNQRQNVANNDQLRQSTSTRPSTPPSIHGQQSPPAAGAGSIRQQQQKSPGGQRGTGGTKKLRFLFGTVTPADIDTSGRNNGQSTGNKANGENGPSNGGGNGPSNGQGSSNGQGTSTANAVHGPTNQGGNEAKKGAAVAKSGQKPAPPPADDITIPKSKFADRSKPSAGGSRRE